MANILLQDNRGYTFTEILVAITILGLVITPILTLFISSFQSINHAGKRTTAVNLCREQLEQVKAAGYSDVYRDYLEEGSELYFESEIEGFTGFSRETRVEPYILTVSEDTSLELLQITVTVKWQQRNIERVQRLISFSGHY
ncbi:MAG: type II secretion system protein [Bacillota bacterium]|nr:type II secretion system protein [Bacillota bacterium]